jgi:hypothetical protein
MVSIDIPTAVLAVLVSVTLSPFINLISEGIKAWAKRWIDQRDQLEDWNQRTVELAKDAKLVWQTQYEEQDTDDFKTHRTWARNARNSIRETKRKLRNHARSAPPSACKESEQKLAELIACCEAFNESEFGQGSIDDFRECGQSVKQSADKVIDVTPHE